MCLPRDCHLQAHASWQQSVRTCDDVPSTFVPSSSRCVSPVETNSGTSEVLPLSESGNQLATVFTTKPLPSEVLASDESGSQSEIPVADCSRPDEELPVALLLSSAECSSQPIAEVTAASKDEVLPCPYGSVSQFTTFEELMPLPKRHRPSSKNIRKKPPSYELTGTSTMQFVCESAQKKGKRSRKGQENKAKKQRSKVKCQR